MKSISIIIPAFNESALISNTLRAISAWTPPAGCSLKEILVIDDGSHDSTAAKVGELTAEISSLKLLVNDGNRGKGFSVRRGVLASEGDIIGYTDADLAYDPAQYNAFIEGILHQKADIVAGSRHLQYDSGLSHYSRRRVLSTYGFQLI